MSVHEVGEEYLEALWSMGEAGETAVEDFAQRIGGFLDGAVLDSLETDVYIIRDPALRTVGLTEKGRERTEKLIRSHRIAERLIADVLGGEFEEGACEFEHIKNPGLVDSLCTLLGHPRSCPHGLPIPEGDCCRLSADFVQRKVIPLKQLGVGESAVIAYVYSKNDRQLHVMEGMQLRPGVLVKLHQKRPTYVLEVDDMHIACDENVAGNIQVWVDSCRVDADVGERHGEEHGRRRRRWGRGGRRNG